MHGMVQELGADPAATDASRVLRVPGLYNHKYARPHLVRVEDLTEQIYHPSHFPQFEPSDRGGHGLSPATGHVSREPRSGTYGNSQSERDWAYALRVLARGDEPDEVIRAIAAYRPDKSNPRYYAEHTVEKALEVLNRSVEVRVDSESSAMER